MSSCMPSITTNIKALVPIEKTLTDLDPSELNGISSYFVADNVGIKFVHINAKNDYEYILAKKISFSEDKKEVRIVLNQHYFSDGTRITSSDVVNSLKRLHRRGSAHIPMRELFGDNCDSTDAKCFSALDENTVMIQLKRPSREFLYYLSLADSIILHRTQLKDEKLQIDDWSISSGAYVPHKTKLVKNKFATFGVKDSPDIVELIPTPSLGEAKDFSGADMGYSIFVPKKANEIQSLPMGYRFAEDGFSFVNYLAINTKRFVNKKSRQWLAAKIRSNFLTDLPSNPYFKKASQFFLEGSIAYDQNFHPSNEVLEVPDEFKNGVTILTAGQAQRFLIDNFDERLSRALGVRVKLNATDSVEQYRERNQTRDYDIYFVPTSASYNVVTETLNLLYKAKKRLVDNPNGKVLKLMEDYQQFKGNDKETLSQIVKEMADEAEVIPLYYLSSPKFYNSKTVDISEMNPNESMTFWKVRVL